MLDHTSSSLFSQSYFPLLNPKHSLDPAVNPNPWEGIHICPGLSWRQANFVGDTALDILERESQKKILQWMERYCLPLWRGLLSTTNMSGKFLQFGRGCIRDQYHLYPMASVSCIVYSYSPALAPARPSQPSAYPHSRPPSSRSVKSLRFRPEKIRKFAQGSILSDFQTLVRKWSSEFHPGTSSCQCSKKNFLPPLQQWRGLVN
jgi:hypothetical protein